MPVVQYVDSAVSVEPPGRSDVVESAATAHSFCENCLLGLSPPAAVYCLSSLLSAVETLLMTAS